MERFAAVLRLLALWRLPEPAADIAAEVVSVSDGDTPTVMTAEERGQGAGSHAIDPPETGQDFGTRVQQAASELTFGRLAANPMAALCSFGTDDTDALRDNELAQLPWPPASAWCCAKPIWRPWSGAAP